MVELVMALGADLLRVDEQLDVAGAVLQGREAQAALAAKQHDPARDLDAIVGRGTGRQVAVRGSDVGRMMVGVIAERVGVDTRFLHGLDLVQPDLPLALVVVLFLFGRGIRSALIVTVPHGGLVVVAHRPGA